MTNPNVRLFSFLGSRYDSAQFNLDELRLRALELVIAGCVIDARDHPVVDTTRREQVPTSVVSEDGPPPREEEGWPLVEPEPGPQPEPLKKPETGWPAEWPTSPPQPSSPPSSAPEEPVRGSWEPPKP